MDEMLLTALILAIVAFPLFAIGLRFRGGKGLHLLAGVDPAKVKDREGLAKHVGTGLVRLGVLHLLYASMFLLLPRTLVLYATLGFVALVSLLVVHLVFGLSRFQKP